MLSKKDEQAIQEGVDGIKKVMTTIPALCSKIGEIEQDILEFIVRDIEHLPSKSDVIRAYPIVTENRELAYNVVELYRIFDFTSEMLPQSMQKNQVMHVAMHKIIIPKVLSEVRASLLDTTSVSEISTSTLDTTMGTNSSVLHGSSDYCEL